MRRLIIWIMALGFSIAMHSQDVVVRDADDRTALPHAEISNDRDILIYTSKNGVFQLDTFKNETFIYVTYNGYYPRKIVVKDISKKDPTIRLDPKTLELKSVIIKPKGDAIGTEPTQQVEVMSSREMQFGNPSTSASILANSGLVSVQQSQLGGGSPQMRGFEANKVLLVIDGVRMNNAIYRSGHVQNAITVDANILDKTEVYFGPASVLFGSDALGGAIHFKTKKPVLAEKFNKNITRVNILGRIASASEEQTIHTDIMFGAKKWGFLTSITRSEFGNLRMGKNRPHGDDQWGLIPYYAAVEEGVDVQQLNGDQNTQKYTAYDQIDFLQKLTYKASEKASINVNFQFSNSTDIPRFDRLNDITDGEIKWAEWYYGPQKRFLTSVNLNLTDRKYFTEANITLAHQRIDEDRIKRRFGRIDKFYNREDVNVISINADFILEKDSNTSWFYGLETVYNNVKSTASEKNIITGEETEAITRYPSGGSDYTTLAMYASRNKKLSKKTDLNIGLRYNQTIATSKILENSFYTLPYDQIKINDAALTGSIGIIHRPSENWKLAGGVASGFKSPNVDDYGKIFEKDGIVVLPNADLKSEYVYSADVTVNRAFLGKKLWVSATPFYTFLTDAIVRRDTVLNGSDTFLFEGELADIQTNKNASQAHVLGVSAKAKYLLAEHWLASATFNYTYGQDLTDDIPMSHITPEFGKVNIEFQKGRFTGEAYMLYAFKKDLDRYGKGTTDNLAEALETGTPSWKTLNIRTSTKVSKTVVIQLAVENILDVHYKTFASGLSAPGRNVILSLKTFF